MKIRFYCDVPTYLGDDFNLFAFSKPHTRFGTLGEKRIAFDVNIPDEILKRADIGVPAEFVGIVPKLDDSPVEDDIPAAGKGGAA